MIPYHGSCRSQRRPLATSLGRLLWGIGGVLSLLLLGIAVVAGSAWLEKRFPSDDATRALSPRAQRLVTKPVVTALGGQVERYVQSRLDAPYLCSELSLREAIARFLDEGVDLAERRHLAFRLAHVGTRECIAALGQVLATAPPEHRAWIADLIGRTANPALNGLLWQLLRDADESVVVAAIGGLGLQDTPAASAKLAEMLRDPQQPQAVRLAAAAALGNLGGDAARQALVDAFAESGDADLTAQILSSLGRFPFPSIAAVVGHYIAADAPPPALRLAAVEALSNSSPEAVPFLVHLAAADADEDVRAAAAWAVSAHHDVTDQAPALALLAEREPSAEVRRRLYEALLPQRDIPAARLLPLVQAEADVAARVAGFNAIARAARQQPLSHAALAFDRDLVPELAAIATAPNSPNLQMRAVFALRRAGTATAVAALEEIAANASPHIAAAARNGLRAAQQ